jgi:arylsulfatase A-like enzyme
MRFKEWYLVDAQAHGTSHGSPYSYDTDVPLLFFGAGVRAGMHERPAGTIDLAPTLAALLGLRLPDDLDGRSLVGPVTGH